MPARFTLTKLPDSLKISNFKPHYNIAPKDEVLVLINGKLEYARFGFVRDFTNNPIVNSRSEKIDENKVFSKAFKSNRCVILADSFYEWEDDNGSKTPYRIMLENDKIFGMAGLYEIREEKFYVAIITCDSNELVGTIHNRMPIILEEKNWEKWIAKPDKNLLQIYDSSNMKMYQVSKKVNKIGNNDELLIREYKEKTLFDY